MEAETELPLGVLTEPRRSGLLTTLVGLLPRLERMIAVPDVWEGERIVDPGTGFAYSRLFSRAELLFPSLHAAGDARLRVGLHRFSGHDAGESALHNHRWPLAVLPLDEQDDDVLLYTMPWEVRGEPTERGELAVHAGAAYAIERHVETYHAVQSVRPHLSINLTDVTEPPSRPSRLVGSPLSNEDSDVVRLSVLGALARWLRRSTRSSGASG